MAQIFANNVAGTLAAGVGPSDTILLLGAGQGALFPSPAVGEHFYATLVNITTGVVEVVQCTSRSGDSLTVVRGRDNTTAVAFSSGDLVEMRLTAQVLREVDYNTKLGVANGIAQLDSGGKLLGSQLPSNVPTLTSGKLSMSVIPTGVATDTELDGKADVVHTHSASQITSGVFSTARLGSGSPSTAAFLRGDGTWSNNIGSGFTINGSAPWTAATFSPSSKLNTSGGTITGDLTVDDRLTVGSVVIENNFVESPIFSRNGATLNFRPNGSGSTTGAATLSTAGLFSAVDLAATSDRNKKADIIYCAPALGISDALAMADFKWVDSGLPGRGPIAQDIQLYAPQFVHTNDEGTLVVDKAGLALELVADLAARMRRLEKAA